jgi:hypothetical protein
MNSTFLLQAEAATLLWALCINIDSFSLYFILHVYMYKGRFQNINMFILIIGIIEAFSFLFVLTGFFQVFCNEFMLTVYL